MADLSCGGDCSDRRSPGESGRGLESNGTGDGTGRVFTSAWVLGQRVLRDPETLHYLHPSPKYVHIIIADGGEVIRNGNIWEFNSFSLSRWLSSHSIQAATSQFGKNTIFWHFRSNSGSAMVHENTVSTVLPRFYLSALVEECRL